MNAIFVTNARGGEIMCDGFSRPVGTICDPGLQGPKGMPGPYSADSERDLIVHLICELEQADYYGERIGCQDGENPKTAVDCFVLSQALDALKNYEALLRQPLYELVAPGFFHVNRPAKTCKGIR